MVTRKRMYADLVDSNQIGQFKDVMKDVARRTRKFPGRRNCVVDIRSHSGGFEYRGQRKFKVQSTLESLGHKNVIAEKMYAETGDPSVFAGIGKCTMRMSINDLIASGTMPVTFQDEVAAGASSWFTDMKRARVIGESFFEGCKEDGVALVGGESPALPFLVKEELPVMSGVANGFLLKDWEVPDRVRVNDCIVGVHASTLHSNGSSLIIRLAEKMKRGFFTKLPGGTTFGEEVLVATRSYVSLVETLLANGVRVHKFLPGTGDGVAKLGTIEGDLMHVIDFWPAMPLLFQFLRFDLDVSLFDMLTTFNCGIGYYVFVPRSEVDAVLKLGRKAGYTMDLLGVVKHGKRGVVCGAFKGLWLPPPH